MTPVPIPNTEVKPICVPGSTGVREPLGDAVRCLAIHIRARHPFFWGCRVFRIYWGVVMLPWIVPGVLWWGVGCFVFVGGVVTLVGWIVRDRSWSGDAVGGGVERRWIAPRRTAPRAASASPADVHRTRSRCSLVRWASLACVCRDPRGATHSRCSCVRRGSRSLARRAGGWGFGEDVPLCLNPGSR